MRLSLDRLNKRILFGATLVVPAAVLVIAWASDAWREKPWLYAAGLPVGLLAGALVGSWLGRLSSFVAGEVDARVRERMAQLRLAAGVLENTGQGVMVVSADGIIVHVNPAFTQITGYTADEVVGQSPRLLRSDYHDDSFYRTMLQHLLDTGSWQGEIWNRRKNGEVFPEWLSIDLIPEGDGVPACYVGVFTDITEQWQKDERVRHLAFHDALTGLPNRVLLFDRLQQALLKADREERGLALLFVDLDRFKSVNDRLGHQVGDLLLQEVGKRLCASLRGTDTVARLGGDEFVVLLENLDQPEDAAAVSANLIAEISKPQEVAGYAVQIGASVGIALYPDDGEHAIDLMKHADTAMYAAKLEGKGTYRFFRLAMTEQAALRVQVETELRRAVDEGQLELLYQPQVSLADGHILRCEALLRWRHPQRGLMMPEDFIDLAEETGLIDGIGDWVLTEACRRLAAWQQAGIAAGMAVNIAARQLLAGDLPRRIGALAQDYGFRPEGLQIELAESLLMHDPEQYVGALRRLRELGVTMAVDEFGTGYSSLVYLRRLPFGLLKIGPGLVGSALDDEDDAQVIRSIVGLGRSLGVEVLAEGVENEAQAEFLRQAGCDLAQGPLFGRPAPAAAVESRLTKALS